MAMETSHSQPSPGNGRTLMRWLEMADSTPEKTHSQNHRHVKSSKDHYLKLQTEANNFISSIRLPLNIISVMGPENSGKSTLINLLVGGAEPEQFLNPNSNFSMRSAITVCPFSPSLEQFSSTKTAPGVASETQKSKVLFLEVDEPDDQEVNYHVQFISPVVLFSRVIIFVVPKDSFPQNAVLDQLAVIIQAAQRINLGDSHEANGEHVTTKFGHLVILYNQYSFYTTVETLAKSLLGLEVGTSTAVMRRNKIRELAKEIFESVTVHALPKNSLKPKAANAINGRKMVSLMLRDLNENYRNAFATFKGAISSYLAHHYVFHNNKLTGHALANLIPCVVETLTYMDSLNIPALWKFALDKIVTDASSTFLADLKTICDGQLAQAATPTAQVENALQQNIDSLFIRFSEDVRDVPHDQVADVRETLQSEVRRQKKDVVASNLLKVQEHAQLQLSNLLAELPKHLDQVINDGGEVSSTTLREKLENKAFNLLQAFRSSIMNYDSDEFSVVHFEEISNRTKTEIQKRVQAMLEYWNNWAFKRIREHTEIFKIEFEAMSELVLLGDFSKWNTSARILERKATAIFNIKLEKKYKWDGMEDHKIVFLSKLHECVVEAELEFGEKTSRVDQEIQQYFDRELERYRLQLNAVWAVKEEPPEWAEMNEIADFSESYLNLERYVSKFNVTSEITRPKLAFFRREASKLKQEFQSRYEIRYKAFLPQFEAELEKYAADTLEYFKNKKRDLPSKYPDLKNLEPDSHLRKLVFSNLVDETLAELAHTVRWNYRLKSEKSKEMVEATKRELKRIMCADL